MFDRFKSGRKLHQLCWVVPDLHAAMAQWTATMRAGPWFWFENVSFDESRYHGRPAAFPDIACAIGQVGDVQIELVSPKSDTPCFFNDLIPFGTTGFHDIALYCDDYDAELKAYLDAGVTVAFSASRAGVRTCWVDTSPRLSFMTQLVEASAGMAWTAARIRDAARDWDGSDPVRTLV